MADPIIRIKRSSVAGKIPTPTQLPTGEIALNTFDGKLFASKNVGIGTTVFVVNPWTVGTGTNTYDTYFTAGNVGIGSTLPSAVFDVVGNAKFTGIVTSADGRLISGIGINTVGGNVGYGVTKLDFQGAGISTITVSAGIATINISGGSGIGITQTPARVVTSYVAISGINTYNVNYQVGYLDVFLNGVRLNSDEYVANDETTVILNESPSDGDILDLIYFSLGIGETGPEGPAGATQWGITSAGIHTLSSVAIGTIDPTSKLTVSGDALIVGVVTATNFSGNFVGGTGSIIQLNVGTGGTVITTTNTPSVGINSTSPAYTLDVGGDINSSTDIKIDGVSVLTTASNDAVALAIALG